MDGDGDVEVQWRGRLLTAGYTDRELSRMRRAGVLTPLRRGAYSVGPLPADAAARHALAVEAACGHLSPDAVVGHVSAAVLHGLPAWGLALDRVHVVRDRGRSGGGRTGSRVHVHSAPLDEDEVTDVDGLPVTAVARTLLDLARAQPFEPAVVLVDAALARGVVTPADLAAALDRAAGWPGRSAARRVLDFADGRSESVGESRSRVAIARCGLPSPVLQLAVPDDRGALIGRVDFGWPELRTVGEFDGRVKYQRLLHPRQSPADAVYAEKLREDRLRARGLAVVRWAWPDLDDFAPVAHRLRAAFRLAPPS